MGLAIGSYLAWEYTKDSLKSDYVGNIIVKLNAQDIIDVMDAEEALDEIKKQLDD